MIRSFSLFFLLLYKDPTKAEQEDFQHDTRTLTRLRHPNIVLLIAVTPPGYTPMAVMTELMRFVSGEVAVFSWLLSLFFFFDSILLLPFLRLFL